MTATTSSKLRQKGVGILEVMIAVAVLSIALLSLGGLHALIIKAGSAAKIKGIATGLASEKIDDLRSFGAAGSGFDYAAIATDSGGNAGNTIAVENVNFYRTWHSYPRYLCGANTTPTTTACKTVPDMRLINVTVYWDNPDDSVNVTLGANHATNMTACAAAGSEACQSVTMQSVISWVSPDLAAQGLQAEPNKGPEKILNTSHLSADQDITHDLGEVLKRVSQPVPDTNRGNNDTTSNTITTFREEYFDQNNRLLGENEFYTVNCYCGQNGAPASTTDYPFGLNPTKLAPVTVVGSSFAGGTKFIPGLVNTSKRRGSMLTGGEFNDQPLTCKICCRDHHDVTDIKPSTTAAWDDFGNLYDPFRPFDDTSTTPDDEADYYTYTDSGTKYDHNHYAPASGTATLANANNNQYAEACRMVWTGGSLRVLQDWRLESLQILAPGFLSNQTNIGYYTDYVTAFVTKFVMSITSDYPKVMPDRSTILESDDSYTIVGGEIVPSVSSALANLTSAWPMVSNPENLTVRGIYIDYMDLDLINAIRCKIDPANTPLSGGSFDDCPNSNKEAYLHLIPFHDVNLTKLAKWESTDATKISVTTDALLDQTETTFSRGKITGLVSGSKVGIKAIINTSNTGLTVTEALDPNDSSSAINPITDCIPVTYGTSAADDPCIPVVATKIEGKVIVANGRGINPNDVYITIKSAGGTFLCTTQPESDGDYSTSCAGNALQGATGLELWIWHYNKANPGGKDNCAKLGTGYTTYSAGGDSGTSTPSVCTDPSSLGVCTTTANFTSGGTQGEYTHVTFSGLTPDTTTTFNFNINGDSTDPAQCSN